jgi:hypothetical protein
VSSGTASLEESSKNHRAYVLALLAAFILLESITVWRHEPWRDEMAVWMVAKYNSLPEMFNEARMQAQPLLWYAIVKGAQQLSPSPFIMGAANLLFISLAGFLMLRYAPFSWIEKVFLCFSYLLFYEYGAISRNYGLTVAVLFAVCALHKRRKRYWMLIAFLLALICSIQIMNVIFAGCFLAILIAERFFYPDSDAAVDFRRLAASSFIVIAGIAGALYQATPPAGTLWSPTSGQKWVFHSIPGALKSFWLAFVPLSEPVLHFWNTNILPEGPWMIAASFIILALTALFLGRKPLAGFFYISGVLGLLFFFCRFYRGFTRHHGFLFLMFCTGYWIYHNYESKMEAPFSARIGALLGGRKFNVFTAVCFVNFCAVFVPVYYDWLYPFSASRQTADYLRQNDFRDCVLLGDVDFCVAPIAGWIDREFYYPAIDDFSKSVKWQHPNRKRIVREQTIEDQAYHQRIWQTAEKLSFQKKKDVLLILNYRLDRQPVKEFAMSIVPDESYYIYRFGQQPKVEPR